MTFYDSHEISEGIFNIRFKCLLNYDLIAVLCKILALRDDV